MLLMAVAVSAPIALWNAGRFRILEPELAGGLFAATCGGGLLLFAAAWLAKKSLRWSMALVSLGVLGSALLFATRLAGDLGGDLVRQTPPGPQTASAAGAQRLRVLQFNVLHGYPGRADFTGRERRLIAAIERLRPDVVVLQEAWRYHGRRDLVDKLGEQLGMSSVYARANGSLRLLGFEEGSAILSRFPIVDAQALELTPRKHRFDRRIALRADLDIGGGRVETVVGVHLTHDDADVAALQAEHLVERLGDTRPLLLTGDFNQPAGSQTLESLLNAGYRSVLSDGVDHILQPAELDHWPALWSQVALPAKTGLSDHPGLLTELSLRREPGPGRWQVDWHAPEPSKLEFDVAQLTASVERIGQLEGVTALIVLRHGALAAERYFGKGGPNQLHNMKSASKSLLSTLVGIAVAEGHLALDTSVTDLLGRSAPDEKARSAITIEHLLTMSSGLESTSFGNYGSWVSSRNWVANALERPLETEPGEVFRYSTGNTHLLSAALTAATGGSTLDYARAKLFEPLGIDGVSWERDRQGIYLGGNNLAITPRAMARFGQLYLDRGRWGDQQVVPWEWIDASIQPWAHSSWSRRGYGYLWWLRPEDERGAYNASGHGGQYIYISPAWDLVVVVNSTEPTKPRGWRGDLFNEIRGGIVGSLPLYPPTGS